ncbi:2-succinyl-6-hydroxy-2,4-cyclohexadiene-1-carboxylate synthase [Shewanella gaetbuli]|uniref:Putative 2-succinyl-6-hydroxy-2,4-cyclohexadiene-1-carboxylate synthase n=1 Tax=Shewanella gaetbuli TaxID=220752 RepID=A0A9X1ZU91_9GAMM|nr:2-succinyl-6-hydroxy-2,4-cyclohexadiene-1-carboxylate synthase [Shewanella gaetbuli]MCL1144223.1 2-succinyl-6-hydroxy-2,4-cyclohexadiene-1-carboxylate synthase [Shewanella gaetbuli]
MAFINRYGDPTLPALVLLHGFMGAKEDWQALMPKLSQRFHCIVIDLPGHGTNQYALSTPGLTEAAAHVLQKVNNLGYQQFHLVGYSLGGRIALHIAQLQPEALLSLTLESANPGLLTEAEKQQRLAHDNRWAEKLLNLPFKQFLQLWYQQAVFADLTEQQRQWLIEKRAWNNPQHLHQCYQATSLGLQADCRQVIKQLNAPCQIVVGEQDHKFTHLARQWQAELANATLLQLTVIPNVGHNIHSMLPQIFCDVLLAFVDNHHLLSE